ncbi:MAG: hypothetical protein KAJ75_00510 [Alphaproteobacteria bacterium]|nr:hypothetical protein [Alphaproteobacteria bacterium]
MASTPTKDEGKYKKRGDIFTIVTHRLAEKSFDVVSIVAGYPYLKNSKVKLIIGNKTFSLFTHDSTAWAHDNSTDATIVKAMINGNKMIVKGSSSRKTKTKDTYSLSGFTAAHKAINKACSRK